MTHEDETWIRDLSDPRRRPAAEGALRDRGTGAVPALLAALEQDQAPEARRSILRLLLQLKEARAESAFRQALNSLDEDTRAIGARGLYLLNAPDALQANLVAINDSPDLLHNDITPAVTALSKMGMTALPGILPFLDSPDPNTRQRAQRVLEWVTQEEIARRSGQARDSEPARRAWRELWENNGSYRYDASQADRQAAIALWNNWLQR
jgi:HEAT repeat protein